MIEEDGIKYRILYLGNHKEFKVIELGGYVDQANVDHLQKLIDESLSEGSYKLIFDFKDLMYLSSAGWGVLIGEIKRFREHEGDIKIINMRQDIFEVYQILEFYHILYEYSSVDEALKSFNANIENSFAEEKEYPDTLESPLDIIGKPEQRMDTGIVEKGEININGEELSNIEVTPPISREEEFLHNINKEEIDPAIMPLPSKVKVIIAESPFLSVWQIRKKLREEKYGWVKIGYFKLRKLLKELDLNTKEKRYRFFRSC